MSDFNTPALDAWNAKVSTPEKMQREIERLRFYARCNEASAIRHAKEVEREKWQGIVAELDATLAEKDAVIDELQARLKERRVSEGSYKGNDCRIS